MIKLNQILMKSSMPLSLKVLWLLADGKEYTQMDLIKKDKITPQALSSIRGEPISIDRGNLSKTMNNLTRMGLVYRKKNLKKGMVDRYYLKWPDSYFKIVNKLRILEERCSIEMEILSWDLFGDRISNSKKEIQLKKRIQNIAADHESYRWAKYHFERKIEEYKKELQRKVDDDFFNEHYPIAEPWSPHLSKFKKLATLIRPLCKIPDKNHGPEEAFAELIVHQLRPELLEAHFKWFVENPLPAISDDRRIRYDGYFYWYHLSDAPFQPSSKGRLEADGMK
jgi:hypothetical protein